MLGGVVSIAIVIAAVIAVGLAADASIGAQGKMYGLSSQEFGYIIRAVLHSRACALTPQMVQPMWVDSCNKLGLKVSFLVPFFLNCEAGLTARSWEQPEYMASTTLRTSCNAHRPHDFADLIRKIVAGFTGSDEIEYDTPLMEAGLDSIAAVEFRNRLITQLGLGQLATTIIFGFLHTRSLMWRFHGIDVAPQHE
jgi:hypothetical protein